ncbi:ABC-three component system middle component 6 [Cryobacterium cryoconiti]|uniref:ABC-three component system middle component 6 n=1 Tax=Cryobacterium cryoconiti TaxID=1259239 RepID=UPI003B97A071
MLTIGAEILDLIDQPISVSGIWEKYSAVPPNRAPRRRSRVTFDWFSLALATLYTIDAIVVTDDGRIRRSIVSG